VDKTAADPMIGRVLDGRYRVGPRIARGGMATVYEAIDQRLDRPCAVKIMHSGMGDDDQFAARFVREARTAAKLSHPNVVSVFDQGDDNGTLFLVMEYIPGHTLRDVIRKEAPMKPGEALELIEPVLSALAAAHQAKMIHRDVKPENVLIAPDGRIKVADFGLARAISAETQHTATGGVLIGTVSYLAPELVVDGKADARSDVYSAGVLLYELLTARKPHEGDTAIQVAYKHVHEDIPPPSAAVRGIPPYVDALVARATARDRDQRPSDARVLLQLVRRVRAAVDSGLRDDPDLTADLLPFAPRFGTDTTDIDYHDETPTRVSPVVQKLKDDATSVIGTVAAAATPPLVKRRPVETHTVRPAAAAPPAKPPKKQPAPGGYKRSRRGPVLLIVVLLLAVLAGGTGWYFGIGRYTNTPGVINLSQAAAEVKVEAKGLTFQVADQEYSETVTKGAVISTDPAAGDRILKNGIVAAIVSLGPERHAVPVLRGLSVDAASAALDDAHLDVGTITEVYSDTIAQGIVIRSNPPATTELPRNNSVALVVSKGLKPITIRDYTNKKADTIEQRLTDLGLTVNLAQDYSEDIKKGRIMAQDHTAGEILHRGDTITLTVSQGPPLVAVPKVVGHGVDEATAELEAAGFKVAVLNAPTYLGLGYVFSQDPGEGTMLQKGETVTIYLV
jgi:serine/threonine protein kinase/beta-lactam-binding protein with PASTA domain